MAFLNKSVLFVSLLLLPHVLHAQTCYDNIKRTAPNARYTLQEGGAEVLDNSTQLIWKRCPEGLSGDACNIGVANQYTWSGALALNGPKWRLPNIKELASLVEIACIGPSVNVVMFPNTDIYDYYSKNYWSSSPSESEADKAWVAFTSWDWYSRVDVKSRPALVRLVRGGQ